MSAKPAALSAGTDAPHPFRFSIVTAVYNVGRYLDEFIASPEAQTFPLERFEVIAVDDGSDDDSLSKLTGWPACSQIKNFGSFPTQGNARLANLGLRHVIGGWVRIPVVQRDTRPRRVDALDHELRQMITTLKVRSQLRLSVALRFTNRSR